MAEAKDAKETPRSPRRSLFASDTPGPGSYVVPGAFKPPPAPGAIAAAKKGAPKPVVLNKYRSGVSESPTPGPGAYVNAAVSDFPPLKPVGATPPKAAAKGAPKAQTARFRRLSSSADDTPGPGAYWASAPKAAAATPAPKKGEKPAFGIRLREISRDPVPGPGQYNSARSSFGELKPVTAVAAAATAKAGSQKQPGTFGTARGRLSYVDKSAAEAPGPGQYHKSMVPPVAAKAATPAPKKGAPAPMKGTPRFISSRDDDIPGPGAYSTVKFPGPPSAEKGKAADGRGFTMASRRPEFDITFISSDRAPLLHLKSFLQEEKGK